MKNTSSHPITFNTEIIQTGTNTTGIQVPDKIIAELNSGKRPPVRVTVNHYTYRSTVAVMEGKFMISVSAEHREAAGVHGGQIVDVSIEFDPDPRDVEIPEDLKDALRNAKVVDVFDKSAPSMRKEYVRQVVSAKAQETRDRRIAKIVEILGGN